MSIIKRLSTTLFSRIDQVVGEIENHDALIEAAINEQRKKIAAAKVQMARVQSHEKRMGEQIAQLHTERQRWEQRAVSSAKEDEQRALACLQRRQAIDKQIAQMTSARGEYAATAARMAADIDRAEEEIRTLSQKHALLRARQSSSEALQSSSLSAMPPLADLETSFDRWETRIAQAEILRGDAEPVDALEEQFRTVEEESALRAELEQLMAKENRHDH